MMRKTSMLTLALSLFAMSHVRADSQLVVNGTSTSQRFGLDNVRSLKFADGNLLVYSADAEQPVAFAIADLVSLKFGEGETTSIAAVSKGAEGALRYANGQLSMAGANGANAALYTVSGQRVLSLSGWDGSPISTSSLQGGVYIFKVDNQTIKFVKR